MTSQSSRLQGQEAEAVGQLNVNPSPAPANWQEMFAAMEARLRESEAELRALRQQDAPPAPEVEICLAQFTPEGVSADRPHQDRFVRGLSVSVARDVKITMNLVRTTYAQTVERAIMAEGAEDDVSKELASRRDSRKNTHSTSGQSKGGGPNEQKRKGSDSPLPLGDKRPRDKFCNRQ